MADTKYERYVRLFPQVFKPRDGDEVINDIPAADRAGMTIAQLWNANVGNPVLNAILRGFAQADDEIAEQIEQTKASLFVKTAENQFLDIIASSLGVSRPSGLGLPDTAFQNLIPPLSLQAKQVRQSFYNAMDAFWGPEFSRANIETLNTTISTFDITIGDTLSFVVDGGTTQSVLIRTTSGIAVNNAATALELNNIILDNVSGVTPEIITDPITKIETIRVRTNSPGIRGSLQFIDGRTGTNRIALFTTVTAELLKQEQRTVIYEIRPNEVVIEIPAFIPTLARGLRGALHVHNGPLTNNLISRGETTNYILPPDLFDRNPVNQYSVTIDANFNAATYTAATRTLALVPDAALAADVYEFIVNNDYQSSIQVTDISVQPAVGALTISGLTFEGNALETATVTLPTLNTIETIQSYASRLFDAISATELMEDLGSSVLISRGTIGKFSDVKLTIKSGIVTIDGALVTLTTPTGLSLSLPDTFKFFVRVQDPLNPPDDTDIWAGAFIFDPNGTQSTFTLTGASAQITGDAVTGQTVLAAGQVHPRVTVDGDTNTLPTTSDLAVIGFGTSTQEPALIRYRGRASDTIIELDPSFVFTQTQPAGTYINIVASASPFVPDRVGAAYPIYLTSSSEARATIQTILATLAAAGVLVTFVVLAPDYKYLIDNPFLDDDGAPGTGADGQQDGYKYIIDNPTSSGNEAPSV